MTTYARGTYLGHGWVITSHRILWDHDDVIKWKHFPRYWPFVRGIHRSPVNSPHKGQWRRALMFSLICVWINGWVNNREAGELRRYCARYDVTVMCNYSSMPKIPASKSSNMEPPLLSLVSVYTYFLIFICIFVSIASTWYYKRHILRDCRWLVRQHCVRRLRNPPNQQYIKNLITHELC